MNKIDMSQYAFLENIPKINRNFFNPISSVKLGDYYIIEYRKMNDCSNYFQIVEKYKSMYKFDDEEWKDRHPPYGPY